MFTEQQFFLFRLIQTSKTGGRPYGDTSPNVECFLCKLKIILVQFRHLKCMTVLDLTRLCLPLKHQLPFLPFYACLKTFSIDLWQSLLHFQIRLETKHWILLLKYAKYWFRMVKLYVHFCKSICVHSILVPTIKICLKDYVKHKGVFLRMHPACKIVIYLSFSIIQWSFLPTHCNAIKAKMQDLFIRLG